MEGRGSDIHEQTTVAGPRPAAAADVRGPATAPTRDAHPPRLDPSTKVGDVLGRYHIDEQLGEGGMGVVYRAFDPQLRRAVALKIMRPAMGEDSLGHATEVALREARALAQLSHPNVVEIFDVGMFGGQLFLAMELLHGVTLSKWLLRQGSDPSWRAIVDVLGQAGQGLAAAHARGVVHRDFKPDNVVITDDGGVRVVDFGLATQQGTTARDRMRHWFAETESRTDASNTGVVAGTPPYMSPEQLRGEPVDARSDQFSFCVTLFRALHRVRPYQGGTIEALLEDMMRRGRPIAVRRRASLAVHRAMLRGLSIDPDQRWPSMDALLEALRPRPSGRRSVALAVGSFGMVTLAAAVVQPPAAPCEPPERAVQAWSDESLEQVRVALAGTGLRYAKDAAERFGPRYRALGERWQQVYAEVCEQRRSGQRDADQADRAMACLYQSLESAQTLAEVVREAEPTVLGRVDDALAALEDPLRCLADEGEEEPTELDAALAVADRDDLRGRAARALMLTELGRYAEALAIFETLLDELSDEAPERLRLRLEIHAGFLLDNLGEYEAAVQRLQAAALEARAQRDDAQAARAAVWLMRVLGQRLQRTDEALQWLRFAESSLEGVEVESDVHTNLRFTHAGILAVKGEHAAALEAYEQARAVCDRIEGDDALECVHITLATSTVLDAMGRHEEARRHYERALARYEQYLGPWHPRLATPTDNLGIVLYRLGDYEGAAEHHARSLEIREAAFGPDNPEVGLSLTNLGLAELELERLADARGHQERAVANWRASLGEEHPHVAAALTNLALVRMLEGAGEDEIIALHRQALQIREASLGPEHPEVGTSLANLGNAHGRKGEVVESRRYLDRARALWVRIYGEGHARVASVDADLGDLARSQRAWDEAVACYERARQGFEAALGPEHDKAVWIRFKLGDAELERGRLDAAAPLLEGALRDLETMPREIFRRAAVTFGVARLRAAQGDEAQARALARDAKLQTEALEATDSRGPELRERIDAWLAAGLREPAERAAP